MKRGGEQLEEVKSISLAQIEKLFEKTNISTFIKNDKKWFIDFPSKGKQISSENFLKSIYRLIEEDKTDFKHFLQIANLIQKMYEVEEFEKIAVGTGSTIEIEIILNVLIDQYRKKHSGIDINEQVLKEVLESKLGKLLVAYLPKEIQTDILTHLKINLLSDKAINELIPNANKATLEKLLKYHHDKVTDDALEKGLYNACINNNQLLTELILKNAKDPVKIIMGIHKTIIDAEFDRLMKTAEISETHPIATYKARATSYALTRLTKVATLLDPYLGNYQKLVIHIPLYYMSNSEKEKLFRESAIQQGKSDMIKHLLYYDVIKNNTPLLKEGVLLAALNQRPWVIEELLEVPSLKKDKEKIILNVLNHPEILKKENKDLQNYLARMITKPPFMSSHRLSPKNKEEPTSSSTPRKPSTHK